MLSRYALPAVAATSAIFTATRYFALSTSNSGLPKKMSTAPPPYEARTRTNGFPAKWPYRASDFQRMDESDDDRFYSMPRFVTHIDDRCIDALSTYYGGVLPQASSSSSDQRPRILDIASSWISHLPEDWGPKNTEVVGIGMNEPELSKNRALSRYLVLDMNRDPQGLSRALSSGEKYDAAICSVSIDYLTQPREMLADLSTILKKDAGVHLAFSNRCFPSKVVGRWLHISEDERCDMVADYFHFAGTSHDEGTLAKPGGLFRDVEIVTVLKPSRSGDPLYVVRARRT
ncbi:hypothetical protein P389DRAFT_171166 [Cystobasidium minutum MCA 4210]|uniref:uncharacterized protein n=1 Tax=Cystobasidium minutum MCA 4210 TaxID=1397322 RepID=UPI0034CD859A|eukprot:jgi/Rhomi1/171166/fgenesh1_kg.4_\